MNTMPPVLPVMHSRQYRSIHERGALPVLTGGSGLYLRALKEGLFPSIPKDASIREKVKRRIAEEGSAALHRELAVHDQVSANNIHPNDAYRIARALEVFLSSGIPLSTHFEKQRLKDSPIIFTNLFSIGLTSPRALLYKRIEQRALQMIEGGLEEEVRNLLGRGYNPELKSMQSIGYRHMVNYIKGIWTLEETRHLLARDTRHYAKRQFTWFSKDHSIVWKDCLDQDEIKRMIAGWLVQEQRGGEEITMSPETPYGVHPAIRQHLKTLGIVNNKELGSYLFPSLSDLPQPTLFKSMDRAVTLLIEAIENNSEILIWGDYDVDGITATALLVLFFKELGISVKHYIPNRITDGYGLNSRVLQRFSETMRSSKLLVTVDCGISNKDEIREAQANGFKVIVTDHHRVPTDELPADATINPKQADCFFPIKELAGVGLAFYLASALRSTLRNNKSLNTIVSNVNMKSFLAYVAIGTIADLMPLTGINRLLVRGGFEVIASTGPANIITLFDALNISHKDVSGETISYQVAPTINAAGRLGESGLPIDLLLTQSTAEAQRFAADIVKLNVKRKAASRIDLESALKMVSNAEVDAKKMYCYIRKFSGWYSWHNSIPTGRDVPVTHTCLLPKQSRYYYAERVGKGSAGF